MFYESSRLIVICMAVLLDLLFGDPVFLYHPVRLMGKMITVLEKTTRKIMPDRAGGILLVTVMSGFWFLLPFLLRLWLYSVHSGIAVVVEGFLAYQMLAAKDLCVESRRVYKALLAGDITLARRQLSMIVGRDTDVLDEEGIAKAAVETIAENTSDGVIAPLFYLVIGGLPLVMWYKAVNTMDSMVGYRNERYLEYGHMAARLDDVANYVPARLSALLMTVSALLCGYDAKGAWRIFIRDRYNHKSPNSAQTEAVCAGALGLLLAGDAWYFGELCHKPYIGDEKKEADAEDIIRAQRLMYGTLGLAMILVFCIFL